MWNEVSLHKKLNLLQAEMLKFNKEISPIKILPAERGEQHHGEDSTFLSPIIWVAISFLKVVVCMIGPALCPAIIYYIEGSSQLFWQVTAVSSIITLLLAMMTVTLLCIDIKKVRDKISETLSTMEHGRLLNILSEFLTSNFMRMNIHKVLYPVILLFCGGLVSYVTYMKQVWIVFYASLITVGYIFGILSTILCDFLKTPELLPFHSPCKIKLAFETPSPKVNKQLEFESHKPQDATPVSHLTSSEITLPTSYLKVEAQTITPVLPNYSPSINHEEISKEDKLYYLPINFSNFFRKMQL